VLLPAGDWREVLDFVPTSILLSETAHKLHTSSVMSLVYPWRFCYAASRHPKAGAVEMPKFDCFGYPGVDYLYAESTMGFMHGNAMYKSILDDYPCVYWEKHEYFYMLSQNAESSRSATLREFVALGFRFSRGDGKPVKSYEDFEPAWVWTGTMDKSRVDKAVLDFLADWEQRLRARYQLLESGRTLAPTTPVARALVSNFN